MTKYTVFEKAAGAVSGEKGGGHWIQVGEHEAASAKAAIGIHLAADDTDGGTYAAAPTRSFKVVEVRKQTRLAFK